MEENQSAPLSSTRRLRENRERGFDSIAHALKIPLKKARSIAIKRHPGMASCLPIKESLCPDDLWFSVLLQSKAARTKSRKRAAPQARE